MGNKGGVSEGKKGEMMRDSYACLLRLTEVHFLFSHVCFMARGKLIYRLRLLAL